MRPNQQNNKQRSRGRNNNNNVRRGGGGNPLSRNYESNGPDVKVRGNAAHIAEKYVQLARDATAVGDGVMAENYLQHAEHYFRIILAAQGQYQPRAEQTDTTPDAEDGDGDDQQGGRQPDNAGGQSRSSGQEQGAAQGNDADEGDEGREQRRPQRQRRQRRPRVEQDASEASSSQPAETQEPAKAEAPAKVETAPAAEGEEKPKRVRRPRQPKKAADDAASDAGELPAFLTTGREAAAE